MFPINCFINVTHLYLVCNQCSITLQNLTKHLISISIIVDRCEESLPYIMKLFFNISFNPFMVNYSRLLVMSIVRRIQILQRQISKWCHSLYETYQWLNVCIDVMLTYQKILFVHFFNGYAHLLGLSAEQIIAHIY